MKSFIEYISEKRELGVGSRVVIDQSRYRSGRDPGRKLERLTGTIKRMKEDGSCVVEFDRAVMIKGKKCREMKMGNHYLSELEESSATLPKED